MTPLIPFDKLPAIVAQEEVKMRNTFIVDKVKLLEVLAPAYDYRPSLDKICRASGLTGSRSSENWSEAAVMAIAQAHGIDVSAFATPRLYRTVGRPKLKRNRTCPKIVPVPEEIRAVVTKAAGATGMAPADWILTVLKACAMFTVAPDVAEQEA